MKRHIHYLVNVEKKPFCFRDFSHFRVDGQEYFMAHGTFRNKISNLVRAGYAECIYYSAPAFYSLEGIYFTKPRREMTDNHTVVPSMSSLSSVSFIDTLPADKHALHDIRFRFKVDSIWTVITTNHPELRPNDVSKDINLDPLETRGLTIRTTVHHTDTVSVIVGCSLRPVAVDVKGLIRLSNTLTRVEERLLRYIQCRPMSLSLSNPIPDHNSRIVTMWHFGEDSSNGYNGETFEIAWEDGENALMRIYTKDMKGGTRIRKERQEYPNKRFDEAINEKLQALGDSN
jgi:hypothetical protein